MKLLEEIRNCTICAKHLPFKPKPVLQFNSKSKLLIVGQAPGTRVHKTGVPWNDPSGERLRDWMKVSREIFYNVQKISIVPMGFCYPGKGKSGDLPPRPECSEAWMEKIRDRLSNIELTLVIGTYAQAYFLPKEKGGVTKTVKNWKTYYPSIIPLPHPSPRNNLWLKKNPWFEKEVVPKLQKRCKSLLA